MILADKIILLRKKCGWSQEQLAEQLNISRQSVSKWESSMSIPDLDKIVKMSALFGVSTDYLLKDEMEEIELPSETESSDEQNGRFVSVEEANNYMDIVKNVSSKIAIGIALCILSPTVLILLSGISEYKNSSLSEEMAAGFGIAFLLVVVAIAASILILNSMKLSKYEYLEKEILSIQYGVEGIAVKRKAAYEDTYRKNVVIGVTFCILGIVPLFIALGLDSGDFFYVCCLDILLIFIAVGVLFLAKSSMIWDSFNKLLQVEDYSKEKKKVMEKRGAFVGAYWCIVTAIFLGASFYTNKWETCSLIWPVAAVLFVAVILMLKAVQKEEK